MCHASQSVTIATRCRAKTDVAGGPTVRPPTYSRQATRLPICTRAAQPQPDLPDADCLDVRGTPIMDDLAADCRFGGLTAILSASTDAAHRWLTCCWCCWCWCRNIISSASDVSLRTSASFAIALFLYLSCNVATYSVFIPLLISPFISMRVILFLC